MIVIIDHYDSFVYNLARYVEECGYRAHVVRCDAITVAEVAELSPSHIILSPGPCTPREAGVSVALVQQLGPVIPMLGVCLGHQVLGAAWGARIVPATRPLHGRASHLTHDGMSIFTGMAPDIAVGRYHSLVVDPATLPTCVQVNAYSEEGDVMAMTHHRYPAVGVQFHLESILTPTGKAMLQAFLQQSPLRRPE